MKVLMLALLAGAYAFHAQLPHGDVVAAKLHVAGTIAMISVDGKAPVRVDLAQDGPPAGPPPGGPPRDGGPPNGNGGPPPKPPRGIPPVVDFLRISNLIAQAAMSGKSSAQIQFGPQRSCVDVQLSMSGDTVTAIGSTGGAQPVDVRIVEAIDHQQLRSAHGAIQPPGHGRGPAATWTITQTGAQ